MFASLQLTNFQSHKLTELDFSEGVNVIVGQSDTGKTAILRAMNWIINGKPRGSGFIYEGSKSCSCCLYVSVQGNLVAVERMRKGDSTDYKLIKHSSEKPVTFTAFGNDIPEEITQVFNFNDINIQDQLSPYFLVLDTPGRVAQYLNEITRLDEIDKVVSLLSKKIRDTGTTLSQIESDLVGAKKELEISQLFDLESFDKKIVKSSELFEESKKLTAECMALALAVAQLEENDIKYAKLPEVTAEQAMKLEKEAVACIEEGKDIARLFSLTEMLNEVDISFSKLPKKKLDNLDMIERWYAEYEHKMQRINDMHIILAALKTIAHDLFELPDCEEKIDSIKLLGNRYAEEKKKVDSLKQNIRTLINISLEIEVIDARVFECDKEESGILSSLTVCPYCGLPLDDEAKNTLLHGDN